MTEAEFKLEKEDLGDSVYITLQGAFNSTTAQAIKQEILPHASQKNILLELSQVTILSSAGVGVLFEVVDVSSHEGKKLIIINPSERVRQVINLTGFNEIFSIVPTLADAKKILAQA
ncbi:MAG: STAS domain-containing protein [Leptospiraceae bacterium]|nr:STAS domain-containing protein [Leptospiraceae bacterium]MDW8306380.1 STAS domain-containing protein [Leptospiraceae bacterium]